MDRSTVMRDNALVRALSSLVVSLFALAACSEDRVIPPPGPSLCGKPPCEATCACDLSDACDPDCASCDPECGECRPASLVCRAPTDAGPIMASDGGDRPESDGGAPRDGSAPAECTTSAQCGGRLCDRARGRCVDCRTTADCGASQRCNDGACVATASCQSDLACTPMGLVCDQVAGRCVECNSAAECQDTACLGHACFPSMACQSSLECAATQMVCGSASPPAWPLAFGGQGCGECNGVVDCGAGEACRERLCTPVCAGRICGEVDGASCGSCPGSDRCLDSGQACFGRIALTGSQYFLDAGDRYFLGEDGRSNSAVIVEVPVATQQPRVVERAPGNVYIDGLAMSSTRIYWALTTGEIRTRAISGGSVTSFAQVPGTPTETWCQALAADDNNVVCGLVDYGNAANSGLYRLPTGGGPAVRFDAAVQPSGLIVDGGVAFFALFNDGMVGKADIATGRRTILAREQGDLVGVIGGAAYFVNTRNELRRVPAGATSAQTVASRHAWAGGSSSELYLVDESAGTLVRTQLDGSGSQVIARVQELGIGERVVRAFRRADGLYVQGSGGGTVRINP